MVMNECRYGKTASRYFDGELDARESAAFEAHLAECAACRERLRAYRRLDALMGARPAAAPGPDLLVRLRARSEHSRPSPWKDAARMSRMLIPVAACLCLTLGVLLYAQIAQLRNTPAAPVAAQNPAQIAQAAQTVAQSGTPVFGYALSESERQYLFGDNADALAIVYPVADGQNTGNGM